MNQILEFRSPPRPLKTNPPITPMISLGERSTVETFFLLYWNNSRMAFVDLPILYTPLSPDRWGQEMQPVAVSWHRRRRRRRVKGRWCLALFRSGRFSQFFNLPTIWHLAFMQIIIFRLREKTTASKERGKRFSTRFVYEIWFWLR